MAQNKDETQPRTPFARELPPAIPDTAAAELRGPGCLPWALLSVAGLALSTIIVLVSGLAGYSSGLAKLDDFAMSTQQVFVEEQLTTWIPRDVQDGNTALLAARIAALASLTPAPGMLGELVQTATTVAERVAPTQTPALPSATAASTPLPATPTSIPVATPVSAVDAPLFDIDALFAQAEVLLLSADYPEAARLLEAVVALDAGYRAAEVQQMLFDAYYRQALTLFRSAEGDLALAIIRANQAEQYGDIGELNYERYIAGRYLDARSQEGLNPFRALEIFSALALEVPNYRDIPQRLFNLRVDLGDRYAQSFDFCPAVIQYDAALLVFFDASVEAKRTQSETSCAAGGQLILTLTPGFDLQGTPAAPAQAPAPIGERP